MASANQSKEIKFRIKIARITFTKIKSFLFNNDTTIHYRIRILSE